jgi:antirestriction protein ArdC
MAEQKGIEVSQEPNTRQTVYDEVTNQIIAQLEEGRIPWVQPWGNTLHGASVGLPINAQSGNCYSGINILLLWGKVLEHDYTTQSWLTYKQAQTRGGNVKKGEKSTTIVYADSFTPKGERKAAREENREPQRIPFLKRYRVFNIDQCEGLKDDLYATAPDLPECEQLPVAENLINATEADFRIGGNRAFYVPSLDYIQVPPQPLFHAQIDYYRTCFHELGHWTGAKHRLDRPIKNTKGSKLYAREELVAEMTSAFVCASLGIVPTVRHADYIGSWLAVLKEDNKAIFRAASQASKAADYLLAFHSNNAQAAA